ncbi:hypothetical protein C4553_03740 [Candidatus Parcubacteria bacterium]|nr:MAG: hypothetical protein C4553_03740 [Candidatus Parcubacteria bacterium]
MKKLILLSIVAISLFGIVIFFRGGNIGTQTLWNISNQGAWLLPLVVVAALIDSINPCAFSVLILTIAFLFSLGKYRSKILLIGSAYIFGLFVVYILIGLGILQALHFFNTPNFMAKTAAVLLVILGAINVINEFFPKFPIKLKIPQSAHSKIALLVESGSIPTAFLLGGFVGLCEFPCTGGPYLLVLGLLHDSATYIKGLVYLILYNLIFVLPLVVILLIASNKNLVEKIQAWRDSERKFMRLGSGLAMIILGIMIFIL